MFYKDLLNNIIVCVNRAKDYKFFKNINNFVNGLLSDLYYYDNIIFYGFNVGYLTCEQYLKLKKIVSKCIDNCNLKLFELYGV